MADGCRSGWLCLPENVEKRLFGILYVCKYWLVTVVCGHNKTRIFRFINYYYFRNGVCGIALHSMHNEH